MKTLKKLSFLTVLLSMICSFNIFAMPKNQYAGEPVTATPGMDAGYEYGDRWTWVSDELCVQFRSQRESSDSKGRKSRFTKRYDMGTTICWWEDNQIKKRDTYTGKWTKDSSGVWSFVFDDETIPIEIVKIDGVLYAFNTFGELQEGYNYWGDLTTGPDGLVVTDNPEFLEWLATQYLPECTSHE